MLQSRPNKLNTGSIIAHKFKKVKIFKEALAVSHLSFAQPFIRVSLPQFP